MYLEYAIINIVQFTINPVVAIPYSKENLMASMTIQEVACGDGENESLLRVVFQFLYFPECPKSEKELENSLKLPDSVIMEALRRLEEGGFITSRLEKVEKKGQPRETVRMYRLTKMVAIIITNESDK